MTFVYILLNITNVLHYNFFKINDFETSKYTNIKVKALHHS